MIAHCGYNIGYNSTMYNAHKNVGVRHTWQNMAFCISYCYMHLIFRIILYDRSYYPHLKDEWPENTKTLKGFFFLDLTHIAKPNIHVFCNMHAFCLCKVLMCKNNHFGAFDEHVCLALTQACCGRGCRLTWAGSPYALSQSPFEEAPFCSSKALWGLPSPSHVSSTVPRPTQVPVAPH